MNKYERIVFGSLFVFVFVFWWYNEGTYVRWLTTGIFCATLFSYYIARLTNWGYGALNLIVTCNALSLIYWRDNIYATYPWLDRSLFSASSGASCVSCYLIVCGVLGANHLGGSDVWKQIQKLLGWLCVGNSILSVFQFFWHFSEHRVFSAGAFFGNPSVNGSFTAIVLPFWLAQADTKWKKWLCVFPIASILLSRASIPLGAFIIMALCYYFSMLANQKARLFFRHIASLGLLIAAVWVAGYFWMQNHDDLETKNQLFDGSGRYEVWKAVWIYFKSYPHKLIGTGLGSSSILLPYIQEKAGIIKNGHYFIWHHSDIYQIFFELGIVGFLLSIVAIAKTILKSSNRPALLSACVTYAFTMTINFPLHVPFQAMLAGILIGSVYFAD